MKKLITPLAIVAAVLAVAVLSYLVAEHYNNYLDGQKGEVSQTQAATEAEHQEQVKAIESQLSGANQENERLMAECQKGLAAYDSLTAFNKSRFEMPVCEVPDVEPTDEQ